MAPHREAGTALAVSDTPMFHRNQLLRQGRCALKARDGQSELLAVGSSGGCAVLFPTDERYRRAAWESSLLRWQWGKQWTPRRDLCLALPSGARAPRRPGLQRTSSITNLSARLVDTIPIVRAGAPLIRGHDKEVGALSWFNDGKLVTIGDDYLVAPLGRVSRGSQSCAHREGRR